MARKPENTFRESVHKHLPPISVLYREKMNNPYSSGTPDDWYDGNRSDLWIEYKFLPRTPQRGVVKPFELLSVLQLRWINGRYDNGRNVAVIIGCPDGGVILRNKDWEREIPAQEFRNSLIPRKDLATWIVGETMR